MYRLSRMASGSGSGSAGAGGSGVVGRDPAWRYCMPVEGNKNGTICNYCGLTIRSGGISRFKYHLSHTDPNSNTKKCPMVPPEVKQEIRQLLQEKSKAKAKKAAHMEDIRAELRDKMGGRQRHIVDEDDDDDEGDDVYVYPADMHPDERDAYRAAVRASKASAWNREQEEAFGGSRRRTGEPSRPSDATRPFRRSHSVRGSDHIPPIAPSLYKASGARQKSVKNLFKGGAIKETMGRLISKFFIYDSVAPNKANSHHFKNMIVGAQQAGNYQYLYKTYMS